MKVDYYTSWEDVPIIMDIPMACRLLGISYDAAVKRCRSGELPAFKVCGNWRLRKDAIMRMAGVEM